MRSRRPMLVLVACVVGISVPNGGCAPDCTPSSKPAAPNVILVTVDTLRADHLGCYGSQMVRTPAMDRLAAEGALFERCYSQTHVTVPSHLSMFSSVPLAIHGVLANDGVLERPLNVLPQVFKRAGYRTAAVVSAKHLGPEYALGKALRDFDSYDFPRRLSRPYHAEEANRHLFRWLRGTCREPLFAWIHYWDVHMPYTPPRPFDRAYYKGDPYDSRHTSMQKVTLAWHFYDLTGLRRRLAPRDAEIEALQRDLSVSWRELRDLIMTPQRLADDPERPGRSEEMRRRLASLARFMRANLPLHHSLAAWLKGVRDLAFARAQYAGEVSYVDHEIGRLRAELERLGIADRTILVVTADHGESFGEHKVYFDHGGGLYEQNLRVPLIIWAPGRVEAGRHAEPVRGLDVAPTILSLAGLSAPETMQGNNLFGSARSEFLVSESNRGRQVMVLSGGWKLIRTLLTFEYADIFDRTAGDVELYDLRNDPDEKENLAAVYPKITRRLGAKLDAWLDTEARLRERMPAGVVKSAPGGVGPQQTESLRALGYAE